MYDGGDGNDAGNPESTAHNHVDPHARVAWHQEHGYYQMSSTVRVVVDGDSSQEVPCSK